MGERQRALPVAVANLSKRDLTRIAASSGPVIKVPGSAGHT